MSVLDQMNETELLALSAFFLARTEDLPNGDPWKAKLLQAVRQLLDRVRQKTASHNLKERSKTWRSRNDPHLHLPVRRARKHSEPYHSRFEASAPWTGGPDGEIDRLRLPYRVMLNEQGFAVIYQHVSKLELEAQANTECPICKASGRAKMHHGVKYKECPGCGGRGWVNATTSR